MNTTADFARKLDDVLVVVGKPIPIEIEHIRSNLIRLVASINRVPAPEMAKRMAIENLLPVASTIASEFKRLQPVGTDHIQQ
jgi:hypothetical protein